MALHIDVIETTRFLSKDLGLSWSDAQYLLHRVKHEGVSFCTKILPKFSKAVLHSIDEGQFVCRPELSDFKWKGRLPRFLRDFLLLVFDRSGNLLPDPDPYGLWIIRQVCEYFYKLALPFDDRVLAEAEEKFISTDNSVVSCSNADQSFITRMRRNVERQYRFPRFSEILANHRPRYGPGTFAWRGRTHTKVSWFQYKVLRGVKTRIPERMMGISGYFKSYPASLERITYSSDTSEVSELLFVPKDSRGPRVIIREPLVRLQLQMAYFDWMVDFLEDNTFHRVNFRSQEINRNLARRGSLGGACSTIDLSEASDRVSLSIALEVFRNTPISNFLKERSKFVLLPSGRLHELKKLAGMGSGLTFATMAFLIHIAISTALEPYYGSYKAAARAVYVYGDDIIVATRHVRRAITALEAIGLKVNTDKSYTHQGKICFRESCGGDYMGGNDVAPVRLRLTGGVKPCRSNPGRIRVTNDTSLNQLEKHCRELIQNGLIHTAEYYYSVLERHLGARLPPISGETPAFGRYSLTRPLTYYDTHSTGNYKSVMAYVPCSMRQEVSDPNLYYYMGQKIRPREISWRSLFTESDRNDSPWDITIPRKVVVRRRRVNSFSMIR